jgi:hypothetical protein
MEELFEASELGLGTEFRSEKIPRNRLGMASVILRKKVLVPRHSEFRGRANSEARNGMERNGIPRKNEVLRNSLNTEQNDYLPGFSLPWNDSEWNSENLLLFLFHGTEFRVVFSFEE